MMIRRWLASFLAVGALLVTLLPVLGRVSQTLDGLSSFQPLAIVLATLALVLGARRWFGGVAGAALLIAGAAVVSEISSGGDAPAAGPHLVIVSHNLSVANVAPAKTIAALNASDADILLLQEANGRVAPFLPLLRKRFPYGSGCARSCDLAIYSRLPVERVRWRFRDSRGKPFGPALFWTRGRLRDGSAFTIATLHQPWPLPPGPQRRFGDELAEAIAQVDDPALVIAGDFNLTPWAAGMQRLDRALRPMSRETRALFSFPARIGPRVWPLPLLPIDQAFAGPAWSLVSARRLDRTGSDHFPIRVELALRDGQRADPGSLRK